MKLYQTSNGPVVEHEGHWAKADEPWNELINHDELAKHLRSRLENWCACDPVVPDDLRKPIVDQEVWAAGVTYIRSKTARMEESRQSGGEDFYDRVYTADRPEIFFKASAARTVGPGDKMTLRSDSNWIVPEPELTLVITRTGNVVGYTIGNDLSCRDIEGENPLYLPQAKTFDRCAAVGPCVLVAEQPLDAETEIRLSISRNDTVVFTDSTRINQIKRGFEELIEYLFRHNRHPFGCLLMTGTGIVPPDDLCLQPGDQVEIEIDGIGSLVNQME